MDLWDFLRAKLRRVGDYPKPHCPVHLRCFFELVFGGSENENRCHRRHTFLDPQTHLFTTLLSGKVSGQHEPLNWHQTSQWDPNHLPMLVSHSSSQGTEICKRYQKERLTQTWAECVSASSFTSIPSLASRSCSTHKVVSHWLLCWHWSCPYCCPPLNPQKEWFLSHFRFLCHTLCSRPRPTQIPSSAKVLP